MRRQITPTRISATFRAWHSARSRDKIGRRWIPGGVCRRIFRPDLLLHEWKAEQAEQLACQPYFWYRRRRWRNIFRDLPATVNATCKWLASRASLLNLWNNVAARYFPRTFIIVLLPLISSPVCWVRILPGYFRIRDCLHWYQRIGSRRWSFERSSCRNQKVSSRKKSLHRHTHTYKNGKGKRFEKITFQYVERERHSQTCARHKQYSGNNQ